MANIAYRKPAIGTKKRGFIRPVITKPKPVGRKKITPSAPETIDKALIRARERVRGKGLGQKPIGYVPKRPELILENKQTALVKKLQFKRRAV